MKCGACKYDESLAKYDAERAIGVFEGKALQQIIKYVEPFIEIQSVYMPPFKKIIETQPGTNIPVIKYQGTKVTMYACPKCKTVRLGDRMSDKRYCLQCGAELSLMAVPRDDKCPSDSVPACSACGQKAYDVPGNIIQ